MKRRLFKKIALITGSVFLLLIGVLCIHIYIVTRHKAPDAQTRAMARIDFKQVISKDDADKITTWMYQQKGVDHVLYNPASNILVFTFAPINTSANRIINNMRSCLRYNAVRFIPSEKDLKSGCPVAATSLSYKAYTFFKHIF